MSHSPPQTPASTPPANPEYAAISRKTMIRGLVASAVIVAGILSMNALQATMHLTLIKPPMPLPQHTLAALNRQIAGRYVIESSDEIIDEAQVEILGTGDYLMRSYRDTAKSADDPTQMLRLNLNYYATGSATPHVPEICWAGAGMKEASCSRVVFDIPNVRRQDGRIVTLRARMISFAPPGENEDPQKLKNVVYLFNVNGDYVATPQEVISRFWKASNKYAFDTKIEVTVGGSHAFCSQQQAQRAVAEFFQNSIEEIEKVLPSSDVDPAAAGAAANPGISQ